VEIFVWQSAAQDAQGNQSRSSHDEADAGRSARGSIAEIDVVAAVDTAGHSIRAYV